MSKRIFSSVFVAGLLLSTASFAQSAVLPVPKDLQSPSNDTSGAAIVPLPTPPATSNELPALPTPESFNSPTPSAPPSLDAIPPLPGAAVEPPAVPAAEVKPAEAAPAPTPVAAVVPKTKKHSKRHRHTSAIAMGKVPYRNIRMPSTIYKTEYDKKNHHLPLAYYESDMDALLFSTINNDDVNGMKSLLGYGKRSLNKPNAQGDTPLIAAVKAHAINVVHVLLGRNADTTAKDANGRTAAQIASEMRENHIAHLIQMRAGSREYASNDEPQIRLTPPVHPDSMSPIELTK